MMLLVSASSSWAQNTSTTNTFDDATSTTSFVNNWWGIGPTITWDGSQDAASDPFSGSVNYVAPFTGAEGEQFMTFFTIANRWGWDGGTVINAQTYTNLSFDIKVDPASAITPGGNYGYLEIGLVTLIGGNWGTVPGMPGWNIPLSATNWTHHDIPIDSTWDGLDSVTGYFIKMWSNGAHTNTLTFNVDNMNLTKPTEPVVIPPPTISSLVPAGTPGLQVVMGGAGNQWQRDALVTPSDMTSLMWSGNGDSPVTYSFTIADFPDPVAHEGFEAHMFLVNGDNTDTWNQTYGGCDWNVPDIIVLSVFSDTNGAYECQFNWKTNLPNANPPTNEIYHPAILQSPTILGTWSVSFVNDTNVTMSGPGGISTNFTIPLEAVQNNFSPASSFIQFGFHKNDNENDGHNNGVSGTFSHVAKTGGASVFDDPLNGATLTNLYAWRKTDQTYVQYVSPTTKWDMAWTLPASGYRAQVAGDAQGPYSDLTPAGSYPATGVNHIYIDESSLPAGNDAYFRLIKRNFSQLQVLLPGETNMPDTVTGKIGTPDPLSLSGSGGLMTVTINAVDDTWHVVSGGSGTINLTSDDASAIMPLDAALVGGTLQQTVLFGSPGTWTITATNLSVEMPAATSSPLTVTP